jgi:UDP-N-acetylglucosamine--N-acetylmuramyl-(pentapeptide) pyrophosphoryl-undecaprenol N-acetylglucosamine transferase
MPDYFGRSDLLVSRAGGSTLAEITASGKAAILIPFPQAADDHQRRNAEALQKEGAAIVLDQMKTSAQDFVRVLNDLSNDRVKLESMAQAARRQAKPRSTEMIIEFLRELTSQRMK